MGSNRDQALQRFQAAEAGKTPEQMSKEAADRAANEQVGQMFLQSMIASGLHTQQSLEKYAQENPQGYNELFYEWLTKASEEAKAIEQQQALEKQAEAGRMQKIAEDVLSGRIMAYAFVDELGNIFHEMQKQAEEAEGEGKDETPAHEKAEGEDKGEKEKEKETPAEEKKEEKKEEGGGMPPAFLANAEKKKEEGEKKEGSAQPQLSKEAEDRMRMFDLETTAMAIMDKVASGYPVSPEEVEFVKKVKLARAGLPVNWS